MPRPAHGELMSLIVKALKNLGGSAEIQEIEDEVARLADITEKERSEASAETGRVFLYESLASARTALGKKGQIKNIGHGKWSLPFSGGGVRAGQGGRAERGSPRGAVKPGGNVNRGNDTASALQRVQKALEELRKGLAPYVAEKMQKRYGDNWRRHAGRTPGGKTEGALDVQGLLSTIINNPGDVFRAFQYGGKLEKALDFVHGSRKARNAAAHFGGAMKGQEALRHLDAINELLAAVGAQKQAEIVERLHEEQQRANLKQRG